MRNLTIRFTPALLGSLLCLLLAGCAADGGSRSTEENTGDGATLYGRLNTSINHVEIR
jgi:hypothetical protein